jgi:GDP-4-dehydro-6-deoxy-D-mannose reductase
MQMSRAQRVAVTGVNGFVGRHLVNELVVAGVDVVGVGHEERGAPDGLSEYVSQDLTRGWPRSLDVDAVVHLAGLSAVGPSFDEPQRYLDQNSAMVTHLAEGLLRESTRVRVLVVSSGAVYDARQDQPLSEAARIGFSSPYVVSKVLVENLVAYYAGRGLDAVVARPFNHIGPGQGTGFLVPDLLAGAAAAATSGGPLRVGDLDTRRDYTDVRDVVRAYRLLVEAEHLDDRVFNICSGRSWSGRELLGLLESEWPHGEIAVEVDESRFRPGDPREIVGDSSRLHRAVGWKPEVDVPTSVRDFVTASRGSSSPGRR